MLFRSQSETGVQAQDNSCSNVSIIGAFDRSGFIEESDSIYAVGTFRVENENDEDKQPFFNLTTIACRKNNYITICNVTRATMYAQSAAPNTKVPNCELDLDATEYILKETTSGMLTGVAESGICYNSILSLDRKSRKIYMSFTKTEAAYSEIGRAHV